MKKTQFIPGATEAMAEYAVAQYVKLLTGYDTWSVDDEALDVAIEELIPLKVWSAAAEVIGHATMGCRPLLESGLLTEAKLQRIIDRLDAIVEWVEDGNEFSMWCEFRKSAGRVQVIEA